MSTNIGGHLIGILISINIFEEVYLNNYHIKAFYFHGVLTFFVFILSFVNYYISVSDVFNHN